MLKGTDIKWLIKDDIRKERGSDIEFLKKNEAKKVREFHRSFPMYKETPLISLKSLSKKLGLSEIYIKDESKRFNLNAFKVLGGSYAVAAYFADKFSIDKPVLDYSLLKSQELKDKAGDMLFVTATDGNHGRGIAWTANQLGYRSVIFMPHGSSDYRVNSIKGEGAEVIVLDCNYDYAVKYARQYAKDNNGVLIQDTAMEDYERIPLWIMQGYLTIAQEIEEQLRSYGDKITHIFLQAGVGSYAAVMLAYFINNYGIDNIKSVVVEPEKANCFYKSVLIGDGKAHKVDGDLDTMMAGLACGVPNPLAWPILRDYTNCFASCPDYIAAKGMKILANPVGDDAKIISGESGAPGMGLLSLIMEKDGLKDLKDSLQLKEDSKVLIINTEGDTDPDNYRRILEEGK